MRFPVFPSLVLILALVCSSRLAALDVLFVGNSFTYGFNNYNRAAITDANNSGQGGVPALFKKFADEGGHAGVNVTIEAVGGQTLAYHYGSKLAVLDRAWDVVVLQEYSTLPLVSHPGGNVSAFRDSVNKIAATLRARNPSVRIYLYETWARPDLVPNSYPTLQAMQNELRTAYAAAAADLGLRGWVPVGDAFLHALADNIAYDPDFGAQPEKVNLWGSDNYHASAYGAYLSALVFYAKVLEGDPRLLPTGSGSAVSGLGLAANRAAALQGVAHAAVFASPVSIIAQPAALSCLPGSGARFNVLAAGAVAYQWRRNGVPLPGANGAVLDLSAVSPKDAGNYDVVLTDAFGTALTSEPATLTVTDHATDVTFLIDVGSGAAGFPTVSPDASAQHWNQLTAHTAGARLHPLKDIHGNTWAGFFVELASDFGGVNTAGVLSSAIYPATAQRDSFFVTGTGTVAGSARGELVFGGLSAGVLTTAKIFASRSGSGAKTGRYTFADLNPVFLNAADNTANTVATAPAHGNSSGTLRLVVEPFDSSGVRQEYGYLGVVELTVKLPAPTALERWTSAHGLGGDSANEDADPDGDGQPNLMEFALGTRPDRADSVHSPEVHVSRFDGYDYLHLTVRKEPGNASANVPLVVEVSSDLENWVYGSPHIVLLEDSVVRLTARDASPVSAYPKRFMRLRAGPFGDH